MEEKNDVKNTFGNVKSPENLQEYIKVSNPSAWLLLIGTAILVVGAVIWSIFGSIDSIVNSVVHVENGKAICYIDDDYIDKIRIGMKVKFSNYEGTITNIGEEKDSLYMCDLSTKSLPKDAVYTGNVILNSYKPITFITN